MFFSNKRFKKKAIKPFLLFINFYYMLLFHFAVKVMSFVYLLVPEFILLPDSSYHPTKV